MRCCLPAGTIRSERSRFYMRSLPFALQIMHNWSKCGGVATTLVSTSALLQEIALKAVKRIIPLSPTSVQRVSC